MSLRSYIKDQVDNAADYAAHLFDRAPGLFALLPLPIKKAAYDEEKLDAEELEKQLKERDARDASRLQDLVNKRNAIAAQLLDARPDAFEGSDRRQYLHYLR